MEILKAHQTKNRCYIQGKKVEHIGILVHSTGAVNKNLKRYVDSPERLGKNTNGNHWNSAKADKAMHAFIGYDKNQKVIVAETLPHDISCWGSGSGKKGSRNRTHIQFEICQGSDTDSTYYKTAIAVTEEYCAHLCRIHGWGADVITSHKEQAEAGYASNHGDPDSWMKHFGDSMNAFRARVKARLEGSGSSSDAPTITEGETVKEPTKDAPGANLTGYETYTVQKGDTLWRIAQKTLGSGPKYKAIVTLNGLTSEKLKAGQVLKIREKTDHSSTTSPATTVYTVKKGDSLWKIAKKQLGNSKRYPEIIALNALTSDKLNVGQKLKLPEA